ncbi:MAG TPA: hypothetical protein VGL99_04660 [Chloroflexota bacterium]
MLGEEARAGRLDPDAVGAVLATTGQRAPRIERPVPWFEEPSGVGADVSRFLANQPG